MRKKCIAIAKKAMVWTLAASMLVATPLTASAAGLRDVYKVEDGWGGDVPSDSKDTRTGTVTSTNTGTYTGVLKDEQKLTGIVLNETDVKMEMDGAYDPKNPVLKGLEVEFLGNLSQDEKDKLAKHLTWKSSKLSVVNLNNRIDAENNKKDPNGSLEKMTLVARGGGEATVTVSLDDHENNIHFTSTATVFVKQYAEKLWFDEELTANPNQITYEGTSVDLNEYLKKEPSTANDEVTFEIVKDPDKAATLKNGVLKFKAKKDGKVVTVVAIGERHKSANTPITVQKANHATKVEIREVGKDKVKKFDWLVNTYGDEENKIESAPKFEAVLWAKVDGSNKAKELTAEDRNQCTDKITWSSKKPAIVEVEGNGDQVTLIPKAVGTAQVVAQSSGGKKGTFNVTVRANMTGFEITAETKNLYSGQTVKLGSDQKYAANGSDNFTETALAWAIEGADNTETKKMKSVASINAKGVLTIKPDLKGVTKIRVTATNAKAIGKKNVDKEYQKAKAMPKKEMEFNLTQIDITSITVYSNMYSTGKKIAGALSDGSRVKTDKGIDQTIAVDRSKTYKVVATAKIDGKEIDKLPDGKPIATALSWVTSNDKIATARGNSNGSGTVAAVKKGKANISINGSAKKGSKYVAIKATFKTNVTVPTKTLVLTTKNSAIAGTNKNQTITLKAALQKGTTSKAKDIVWTATRNGEKVSQTTSSKENSIKGGKLVLKKDKYNVGDTFVVTARLPEAGVQTSMTLKVVKASGKVQFVENESSDGKITSISKASTDDTFEIFSKIQVSGTTGWELPGADEGKVAAVTYTVNKKGIVQLVGNKVTPIKKGNVKITATTADGKKATLTVKVTD